MLDYEEAPTRDLQVQGLILTARLVYEAGHPCTQGEADSMNQTLCENLRNNFAGKIRKACEDAKVENSADLPNEIKASLSKEFGAYQEGYNLGEGGRARGEVDPVRRQAIQMALGKVKEALKAKGHKLADVGQEKINDLAESAVENNPAFMAKAAEIVEARRAATAELAVEV